MALRRFVSFQNVSIAVFAVYMFFVGQTFFRMLQPHAFLKYTDESGRRYPVLAPLWPKGTKYSVVAYLSARSQVRSRTKDMYRLWEGDDIEFSDTGLVEIDTVLSEEEVPYELWARLGKDRELFVNFGIKAKRSGSSELWVTSSLVKHVYEVPKPPKVYLVKDWPILGQYVPVEEPLKPTTPATKREDYIGYWKPVASALLVADWTEWPLGAGGTPATVQHFLSLDSRRRYRPVIYTNQLGLTKDKLIRINTTNDELPLQIQVGPMSLARWQFNAHMEQTLAVQKESLGATDKDIDDMRYMLTETDPVLLGVTMVVSLVHLLLDVLAFKSDISFWSNAKSTKGLSVKTLFTDLITQIIITAFLHEQEASLLVLAPSAVGVVIQTWKVIRARQLDSSKTTSDLDSNATSKMMLFVTPLVMGYTLYSLVREKHSGFYSWGIGSLASSVYALGFVNMVPQIYINYKLKSVAHLPWKFFIYKALNTFIDDLFAFIIRMPTMTRLATIRDDVIFIIFLYQRHIYPVDYTRKHEFEGGDEDETETKKTK